MAVVITNSQFSFVDFSSGRREANCGPDPVVCLPVIDLSDLTFQIIATVSGSDINTFNKPGQLYAGTITDTINQNTLAFENNFQIAWTFVGVGGGGFSGATEIYVGRCTFTGHESLFKSQVKIGNCFSISIVEYDGTHFTVLNNWITTSNTCFARLADYNPATCHTSLIQYADDSNSFGFYYLGNNPFAYYNQIRLPLYLHSPVNASKRMVYERSDGSSQVLNYRLWKDYKFKTDRLDSFQCECLAVMFAHDFIQITNAYANLWNTLFILKDDKIELDWMEEKETYVKTAQNKGMLRMAAPRAVVNSNCNS